MQRSARDPVSVPLQPMPEAAARLRDSRPRLAAEALRAATRRDLTLETRHDATRFRTFLRDCDQHVAQLEQALRDGRVEPMAAYVSTIVPVFRRRRVPLQDLGTMLLGTRDAVQAALPPAQADAAALVVEAGLAQLERPRHLPGDRPRNPILQLLWKGAGILD